MKQPNFVLLETKRGILEYTPMKCVHCGEVYPVAMPCEIRMLAAIGREFERQHKGCVPGENVT